MLMHLTPKCHSPFLEDIALRSVEIPELSMTLVGGHHLRCGRPYPNKQYVVASPNSERAVKDGFFVESAKRLSRFHVVTTWVVNSHMTHVVKHHFTILDDQFDAVSSDASLWLAYDKSWGNRWPEQVAAVAPLKITPVLKLDADGQSIDAPVDFKLPTLERDRVLSLVGSILPGSRCPSVASTFRQEAFA